MPKNNALIPGAEAGYVYDWYRQQNKQPEDNRKKCSQLKKKIDKLSKKNKIIKRK